MAARKGGSGTSGSQGKAGGGVTRRIVSYDPAGGYRVDAPGGSRASAKAPTKRAAEKRAKEIVGKLGGGEVTTRDAQGRFDDSDTVAPGRDPFPPREKKH